MFIGMMNIVMFNSALREAPWRKWICKLDSYGHTCITVGRFVVTRIAVTSLTQPDCFFFDMVPGDCTKW